MDFYTSYDSCFAKVLDSIKLLLYDRHNDIFERLDFDNDEIYQEPLLYTYVSQTEDRWLDCIIYGYEKSKKPVIEVFSNSIGVIYLPQIGYFKTDKLNSVLLLETLNNEFIIKSGEEIIDYVFEPILVLACGIELVKYQHPLLETIFLEQMINKDYKILIADVYRKHKDHFDEGFKIIAKCNPKFFHLLKKNVTKAMLFASDKIYSFADMKAHNMIFLNVNFWDNEIFFVDHITHEGAHVVFNTITYETKYEMFKKPYNTSFAEITGHIWEHSTLYLRFHGLFTYLEITKSLEACMNNTNLSEERKHEAKGRFAFSLSKFKLAIESFERLDIFNEEGQLWFNFFKAHYERLEADYHNMKDKYNFNGQPYDFSWKIFEHNNPLVNNIKQV